MRSPRTPKALSKGRQQVFLDPACDWFSKTPLKTSGRRYTARASPLPAQKAGGRLSGDTYREEVEWGVCYGNFVKAEEEVKECQQPFQETDDKAYSSHSGNWRTFPGELSIPWTKTNRYGKFHVLCWKSKVPLRKPASTTSLSFITLVSKAHHWTYPSPSHAHSFQRAC